MDRIAEWRPVEPAGPDGTAETEDDPADGDAVAPAKTGTAKVAAGSGWGLIGPVLVGLTAVGFAVAAAVALFVLSSVPKSAVAIDTQATLRPSQVASPRGSLPGPSSIAAGELVVDVEGAVANPGVWRLPSGSRVGDAIAAAGGYSAQIDIGAATAKLNLAAELTDGQQIRVPLLGEAPATQPSTTYAPQASAAASLVDVNSATADQLDTLPGIGPVTAAKIIGARPFASIDDLQQRGVVGASELDKIRSLITVGP